MRLGELLVHTGVITAAQRDEALQQQVVYGARLGTNLIELGHAEPDEVAHALARLLRVPAALSHHFARADPRLLARIPAPIAARFSAYPIAFADTGAGRRLVLCLRDPTDRDAVAALAATADVAVLACVAPELVLFEWMERGYGVRRPERYRRAKPGRAEPLPRGDTGEFARVDLAAALDDDLSIDIDLDDEEDMPSGLQLVDLDHGDVERDFSHYDAPGGDRDSLLDLATPAAAALDTSAGAAEQPTLDAAAAVAAIGGARDREHIADATLAFLRHRFAAGVMLIAKDGMALGHRGFGGSFDATTVQSILIPLSAPSMFRTAFEAQRTCRGPAPSGGKAIHDRFFKLFPLDGAPEQVVVAPVFVRNRVVCLLYAHADGGGSIADGAVAELERVAAALGETYLRLIREARRS